MSLNREEVAADLVWRYIEHLRTARAEGVSVELTPGELEQLFETMRLAGQVPDALTTLASDERRAAVRRRLEAMVHQPTEQGAAPAEPRTKALLTGPIPIWRYRATLGLAAALAMCLSTVSLWHHPSPVVKRVKIPVGASGINVQPIDEAQVHDLIPRMLQNQLPPQQERNLMWHMLVCRGCFNEYVQMRHSPHTASELREELIQFVRR